MLTLFLPQAARKKLESRRLAYDATMGKMQKAKKDDIRLEEELRVNKTKFDDSTEDVFQRMQDIREAEQDTIGALTSFLDAELEYHERAANELRRIRRSWANGSTEPSSPQSRGSDLERIYPSVSNRSQPVRTAIINEAYEGTASSPVCKLNRTMTAREPPPPPPIPASTRPPMLRSATFDTRHPPVIRARAASTSFSRMPTNTSVPESRAEDNIFDDNSVYSGDNTPSWGERSVSPATSYGSLPMNSQAATESKKAPPPPVNRAKKPPPPPVPRKLSTVGY